MCHYYHELIWFKRVSDFFWMLGSFLSLVIESRDVSRISGASERVIHRVSSSVKIHWAAVLFRWFWRSEYLGEGGNIMGILRGTGLLW